MEVDAAAPGRPYRGAKAAEAYGFVGSITIVVVYVMFLVWSYVPDKYLRAVGIDYYPDKYWAVALPAYGLVCLTLSMHAEPFHQVAYQALNMIATPPPSSLHSMHDRFALAPSAKHGDSIPHISDIPLMEVNRVLYS